MSARFPRLLWPLTATALALSTLAGCPEDDTDSPDTTDVVDTSPDTSPDIPDASPDTVETSPDTSDTASDSVDTSPDITDTNDNADTEVGPRITLPDPNRVYFGRSLPEWGSAWWRWLYGMPLDGNPAVDRTGEDCGNGQGGPVFFLGPAINADIIQRTCRVPAGKWLFIPLSTIANDNGGLRGADRQTTDQLRSFISYFIGQTYALELEVNGQKWSNDDLKSAHRSAIVSFDYSLPSGENIYDLQGLEQETLPIPSFHAGYYVLLEPLPVGTHQLDFSSTGLDFSFRAYYTLEVYEPEPEVTTAAPTLAATATTAGKTLAEWGEAWVQWYFNIPWGLHPQNELSSWHCVQNQTEDAFFLLGGQGSTPCNVPSDKPLVVPLLNGFYDTCGYSAGDVEDETAGAIDFVTAFADASRDLRVTLDGEPVFTAPDGYSAGQFRTGLRTFPITSPDIEDSVIATFYGSDYSGACDPTWMDGFYVVLDQLAPGTYELQLEGSVRLPDHIGPEAFVIDTTYNLVVAPPVTPKDPTAVHYGKSLADWGSAWWQWLYSLPATNHPVLDVTGEHCATGQSGDVFFLAGTFGGPGERTCDVPADKALLFPILNAAFDNGGYPVEEHATEEALRADLTAFLAGTRDVSLQIDAELYDHDDLAAHLIPVTEFTYTMPLEDSIYELWELPVETSPVTSYSGGYYVLLDPLPPGLHHIRFKATHVGDPETPDDDFAIDMIYHLQVGTTAR